MQKTMGEKLKELRIQKNLTKDEVSRIVGISIRALESYETNQRTPRDTIKVALANCYDESVEKIFFE